MKKTALVTGGAGFIGSHLCEELLKRGYDVISIDDLSTGSINNIQHLRANPDFCHITADITEHKNAGVVAELVDKADHIYHLAAVVGVNNVVEKPSETLRINLEGTEKILRQATKKNKKVLVPSSSEVYGKNGSPDFKEDDDILLGASKNSRWCYATSKLMDEHLAFAYFMEKKLPVIIVRLFNTIGPRQTGRYGMVVPRFITWALKNEPIQVYGSGNQKRCFCYVGDVVDALIRLMESPAEKVAGKLYNLGNPEEISIKDLAEKAKLICQSKSEIVFIPYEKAYAPGFEDMERRKPSIDKIKETIGWEPKMKLDEILKKTKEHIEKTL